MPLQGANPTPSFGGFGLSRMVHRIRDTAFEVGLTNWGRALYRDSQALSPREKAALDAGRMGFPQF